MKAPGLHNLNSNKMKVGVHSGRPVTVLTPEVLQQVQHLLDDAAASDHAENQRHNSLGLRPSTWQKAIDMLPYHPYQPTTVPCLFPVDAQDRMAFARSILNNIGCDAYVLQNVLTTDESDFDCDSHGLLRPIWPGSARLSVPHHRSESVDCRKKRS